MYADELAWKLKDKSDDEIIDLPNETLIEYAAILRNHRPMFHSDLAQIEISRLTWLIKNKLSK